MADQQEGAVARVGRLGTTSRYRDKVSLPYHEFYHVHTKYPSLSACETEVDRGSLYVTIVTTSVGGGGGGRGFGSTM